VYSGLDPAGHVLVEVTVTEVEPTTWAVTAEQAAEAVARATTVWAWGTV
jgi:hypothetical protein